MTNPFSWDFLTSVPASDEVLSGWAILFAIVFAGGFLAASVINYRAQSPFISTYFRRRPVQQCMSLAMWIFGIGLFFFLIRLLQINPFTFGERIWMAVMTVLAIVLLLWIAVQVVLATRRGPLPKAASRYSPQGYHAAPTRRPVRRRHT